MQAPLSARFWIWGSLFTVLAILGVIVWIVIAVIGKIGTALSTDTQSFVRLKPVAAAGPIEFEMGYGKDVTGLSVFIVKSAEGTELWKFSGTNSLTPSTVIYGVFPAGPPDSWKQEFPLGNQPPADIRGKSIQVEIDCGYNIAFGPGHQRAEGEFDIPK